MQLEILEILQVQYLKFHETVSKFGNILNFSLVCYLVTKDTMDIRSTWAIYLVYN